MSVFIFVDEVFNLFFLLHQELLEGCDELYVRSWSDIESSFQGFIELLTPFLTARVNVLKHLNVGLFER